MKLNVDESLFFDKNKAIVWLILRDIQGDTCLAANISKDGICDLEHIELVAILKGL